MNTYKKIALIGCLGFGLFTSCDVMDTRPFETYDEELVWSSKEMADAFVLGTYPNIIGNFVTNCASWQSLTPDGAECDQVGNYINTTATETGLSSSTDYGFGRFNLQRRCNQILEHVESSQVLSDDQKKELIGEAHFLRGLLWFDMTRKMGRFVPITKVLTQDDTEAFHTPLTSSIDESYKLILDELNLAVEGLPETSDQGRANKYAALAFRSRAALQAYAYTKDESYLDVVINSSNEVINSGKYVLTDNYGGMFSNDVAPSDPEIILARYYLDSDATVGSFSEMQLALPNLPHDDIVNGSSNGIATLDPSVKVFDGWGVYWPTQNLVDKSPWAYFLVGLTFTSGPMSPPISPCSRSKAAMLLRTSTSTWLFTERPSYSAIYASLSSISCSILMDTLFIAIVHLKKIFCVFILSALCCTMA